MFSQSLSSRKNHFCYLYMMLREFVKCRIDNFSVSLKTSLHICNFFRPFINQQNYHLHVRIIFFYAIGHFLKKHCFSGFWRRYDQTSLPLSYRRH